MEPNIIPPARTSAFAASAPRLVVIGSGERTVSAGVPVTIWMETLAQSAASLEAVCILQEPALAQELCRRFAGRWPFASLEQLVKESEFDLAVLLAPPDLRAELARVLLRARRAVLVPGLPTEDLAGAKRLLSVAEKADRGLLIGWPMRFSPAWVKTRQLLRSGRIGTVTNLLINETVERRPEDAVGGPESEALASMLDRVVQLAGLPAEVLARTTPLAGWSVVLTNPDGVLCSLVVQSVRTSEQTISRLEVRTSEDGYVILEDGCRMTAYTGGEVIQSHHPNWMTGSQPRVELGYSGLVAEALSAIAACRPSGSGLYLSNWLDTWRVLEAVIKSAATGKVVRL